jgi:hypothetical protein
MIAAPISGVRISAGIMGKFDAFEASSATSEARSIVDGLRKVPITGSSS